MKMRLLKRHFLSLLALSLLSTIGCSGGGGDSVSIPPATGTVFEKTLSGAGWEFGTGAVQTPDDGYIVMGSSNSGGYHTYLTKVNSNGNADTSWGNNGDGTSTFTDTVNIVGTLLTDDPDGGYIIYGVDNDTSGRILLKFDTDGYIVSSWGNNGNGTATIGLDHNHDLILSISSVSGGGYILAGQKYNANGSSMLLAKTGSDGSLVSGWGNNGDGTSTFSRINYDLAYSAIQCACGGYIAAGSSIQINLNDYTADSSEMYILKTDSNGIQLSSWGNNGDGTSIFLGDGYAGAYDIQAVSSGGYIVFGGTSSGTVNGYLYLVRIDANGTTSNGGWERTLNISSSIEESCIDLTQVSDGYLLSGYTYYLDTSSSEILPREIFMLKTDTYGVRVSGWGNNGDGTSTFSGDGYALERAATKTSDGGFLIVGTTSVSDQILTSIPYPDTDIYLIKTDSNGLSQ